VSYSAASAVFLPYWVAKERDLYRRYGVDTDLIYLASASKNMQVLISNDIQFAGVGTGGIEANIQGGGTVYVASFVNHFIFSLYSDPRVTNVAELKGSKIGVTRFGTSTEYAARFALSKYGLNPDKDVAIIQTGGIPETLAAITSGAIKAGIVSPPTTLRARKLGLKEIIDITRLRLPFIQAGAVVTEGYIRSNRESVKRVLEALVAATSIIKNDKPFAKMVIDKYVRLKDDELTEETYNALAGEFPSTPYTSIEALRIMAGIISERQKRPVQESVEKFVDNSFLRELEGEGFVKKLYAVGAK
jgi:ABC-type nitrate/sulfonate/bicarbonate transport system substrate-binding protein